MENRWQTMVEGKFDFGFAVEWMRKDLRICLEEARRNGAELPVRRSSTSSTPTSSAWAGSRWDTSSLIARLNRGTRPAQRDAAVHPVLADLLHLLTLERIEDNIFRGESRDIGSAASSAVRCSVRR
jgi:hypothetical protein